MIFFFQAEDGIRDIGVTGVQTCALPICVRDGGCLWPGCDRPPAWCEAHHINQWKRDHGRTDIADGVLLCKHHHLLLHNNGWDIVREGGTYTLIDRKRVV